MRKNIISMLLVAIFAFTLALGLVGCKKDGDQPKEAEKTEEAAPAEEAAK